MKEKLWAAVGITCLFLLLVGVVYGDNIYDSVTGAAPGVPDEPEPTDANIKVVVRDAYTNKPISGAEVYLNGRFEGTTHTDGGASIDAVEFGEHAIEARYDGVSNSKYVTVSKTSKFFTIELDMPKDIAINLKDTETGKAIEDVTVFLVNPSDTSTAYRSTLPTDELGKAVLNKVVPGEYQVRLESEAGDWKTIIPAKYATVTGTGSDIALTVDMPNPKLKASLNCITSISGALWWKKEWGSCEVTLRNMDYERAMTSTDSVVVVLMYAANEDGSNGALLGKDILEFERLAPGQSETLKTTVWRLPYGPKENAYGILIEGWEYTPENEEYISGPVTIPHDKNALDKVIDAAFGYCAGNIGKCAETVAGIIGGFW